MSTRQPCFSQPPHNYTTNYSAVDLANQQPTSDVKIAHKFVTICIKSSQRQRVAAVSYIPKPSHSQLPNCLLQFTNSCRSTYLPRHHQSHPTEKLPTLTHGDKQPPQHLSANAPPMPRNCISTAGQFTANCKWLPQHLFAKTPPRPPYKKQLPECLLIITNSRRSILFANKFP